MKLYYTISEVADILGVNQSLLRYWETEFVELKPMKNSRGARMYRQEDIDLLKRIHYLTKECGFTLDGARDQLRAPETETAPQLQTIETLKNIKSFLLQLKDQL